MEHFADPKLELNTVLSNESYYSQLFKKVNYYSPQIYQIFDIARLLSADDALYSEELRALVNPDAVSEKLLNENEDEVVSAKTTTGNEDFFVDNMRSITEFPYLLKKQFLLPDEVFDRKLIRKELLIKKTHVKETRVSFTDFIEDQNAISREKFLRRQRTYILMDVSGSTEKFDRILLEKAIVISFLENNQKEFGEVYFRTFNHDVGALHRTLTQADYKAIMNRAILPAMPDGQTNTQRALEAAIADLRHYGIDQTAEILLVTDGLCELDSERVLALAEDIKINAVMIGKDPIYFTDDELREHFNSQHQRELHNIEKDNFADEAKKKRQQLEQLNKFDKKKAQREIEANYLSSLRAVAEGSGGKFIEIDDLDQSFFSDTDLVAHVRRELAYLQARLQEKNLSPLERDRLLEEYFSLKNYLNYLLSVHRKSDIQPELEELAEEMVTFLKADEQFMTDLENSTLKVQMSFSDMSQLKSVSMFELFKLLFKKVRYFVFKSSEN